MKISEKNPFENSSFELTTMQASDIKSVLEILVEKGLESWSCKDLIEEVQRDDSILLVCREINAVGFCISRLIMPEHNTIIETGHYAVKSNDKIIKNATRTPAGECEIYNIAVKKEYQKHGIGSQLLTHLASRARIRGVESIWLEVRSSNENAIKFYKNNGFVKIFERKNFYSHPTENAIVMKRVL